MSVTSKETVTLTDLFLESPKKLLGGVPQKYQDTEPLQAVRGLGCSRDLGEHAGRHRRGTSALEVV